MKNKVFALLLICVFWVSVFSGCGNKDQKNETLGSLSDPQSISADRGKLAFQAQYIPLEFEQDMGLEYISQYCISGDYLYFFGDCMVGEEPYVDEITGEPVINELTGEPILNMVYETNLFCMDLNNQKVSHLEQFQKQILPEGQHGNSYFNSIQPGEDGSIWLTEQVNTYYYDLPEDFNPETDDPYAYYTPGENKLLLHHLNSVGAALQTVELNVSPDTYLNGLQFVSGGRFVATDWQSILFFDENGTQIGSIPVEDSINNLINLGQDQISAWIWKEDGSYLVSLDLETMSLGEEIKLDPNAYTIYSGGSEYDYIYDYNGTFFGHRAGMEESEKLFSWLDCDVDNSNIYGTICFSEDGRVFALNNVYNETTQRYDFELIMMEPVDPSTLPVKQELTLACFHLDWDVRADIVEFNKSHEDVRIVVKEYAQYATNEDSLAGLQKLNTEIMSGNVPDLFLISNEMPIDRYAANNVLMDLWPLIDGDPELSRDDLMTHFFDCLSTDGKLYQIVDSFAISTLAGKTSVVGSEKSWTMDDLMAALEAQPEDTTIFGQYDTKDAILNNCISRNAESFINWNTLQCSFDSQEFIDLLKFANQFPVEIDYDKIAVDGPGMEMESEAAMLRSGKQMLYRVGLYSFSSLQWANAVFGEDTNFIGYPTTANNGSCFEIYSSFAISSNCANVDAAWSFIRTYLTEEHQTQEYMYQFPTNRHSFEVLANRAMTTEYITDAETGEEVPVPSTSIWYGMEEELPIYAMTQDELDLFMEIYNNCTNFYSYNQEITELISEEATLFFEGQKTAEETARLIQDRVGLYVMENG